MAIEKIKILGAVLELLAKQHCQFSPFGPFGPLYEVNGLDWQCYLAGMYLQNGPQDFDFFNGHGCQTFILAEIHYYLGARTFHA